MVKTRGIHHEYLFIFEPFILMEGEIFLHFVYFAIFGDMFNANIDFYFLSFLIFNECGNKGRFPNATLTNNNENLSCRILLWVLLLPNAHIYDFLFAYHY